MYASKRIQMTKQDKIIIESIPTFIVERNNISPEIILEEAQEQVRLFRYSVDRYEDSKSHIDKPCMSQAKYKEVILENLNHRINCYLYSDNNSAYKVLFVMAILMHFSNKKLTWWETKFIEGTIVYLEMTDNFKNAKFLINNAVAKIRSLTEPILSFGDSHFDEISTPQTINITKQYKRPILSKGNQQTIMNLNVNFNVNGDFVFGNKSIGNEVKSVGKGGIGVQITQN